MVTFIRGHIKCKHCERYSRISFLKGNYGYCKMRNCNVRSEARAQKCFYNREIVLTVRQRLYFNRK